MSEYVPCNIFAAFRSFDSVLCDVCLYCMTIKYISISVSLSKSIKGSHMVAKELAILGATDLCPHLSYAVCLLCNLRQIT